MAIITHLGNLVARAIAWIFPGCTSMARICLKVLFVIQFFGESKSLHNLLNLSWKRAHFGNGNIEDIAFSFQPILSIPEMNGNKKFSLLLAPVCPIGTPSQIRTPSTLKVGFVAVVLRSC